MASFSCCPLHAARDQVQPNHRRTAFSSGGGTTDHKFPSLREKCQLTLIFQLHYSKIKITMPVLLSNVRLCPTFPHSSRFSTLQVSADDKAICTSFGQADTFRPPPRKVSGAVLGSPRPKKNHQNGGCPLVSLQKPPPKFQMVVVLWCPFKTTPPNV